MTSNETSNYPQKLGSVYFGNGITIHGNDHGDNVGGSIQLNMKNEELRMKLTAMLNDPAKPNGYLPISKSAFGQALKLFDKMNDVHNNEIPFRPFIPKENGNGNADQNTSFPEPTVPAGF